MTERLKRIFAEIPACKSFADVGCDHGYIAKEMIESGKCSNVTVSDVSDDSLNKARKLLHKYITQGVVTAICTDGLKGISPLTHTVLIAGMGGEEIIKILTESTFLPPRLILQPMKNTPKVRQTLINLNYGIVKDYIFLDKNKHYNLLVCNYGEKTPPYSEKELIFGRDNLKNKSSDFLLYLQKEIQLTQEYLKKIASEEQKEQTTKRLEILKEVFYGS